MCSMPCQQAGDGRLILDDDLRLAPYLWLMVNFDLHRRKAFWVDESLAFPACALVFTDRHVLSLGERL